jgi:amidase
VTGRTVSAAVDAAASALRGCGAHVERIESPFPFVAVWRSYLFQLCRMHHTSRPGRDRLRWAERASEFTADDDSLAAWLARTAARTDTDLLAELEPRAGWMDGLEPFFADFDAILMPPAQTLALPHDPRGYELRPLVVDREERSISEMVAWIAPATVLHLPATTAPMPLAAEGLPCGVQILGPLGGDAITIAVAAALEAATGGFVPPPITRGLA